MLSKNDLCMRVTLSSAKEMTDLSSNHEEADTKVILQFAKALSASKDCTVILCSPSGNTDINVLATALLQNYKSRLFIEYGSGSNKKWCWLKDFVLNESNYGALLGLHAFSGNDFVPHFLEKKKLKCWEILQKFSKFEDCFCQLGAEWDLSDSFFNELEEYVCNLYGHGVKNINKVRWLLFQKKHAKENKVIDLPALPACRNVLRTHSERADFVAKVWRSSLENKINEESFVNHDWDEYGNIWWIDQAFPDDINGIFVNNLYNDEKYDFWSDNEKNEDENEA